MDMKITPAEIRGKEFSRAMSGYKKAEVNEFLEELATQTELLLAAAKELEKQIQEKDKKLDDLDEQKDLLRRTLILAEKIKDETISNAKNEAENIIKDAEISSREKVKKAKDYLSILEHDFINLKEKKMQFIVNFKSQLNSMLEILERNIQQESSELKKKSNIEIKKEEKTS
ncbi:MAG: DivIVA domain-containing protein [Candidatus Cloacimonadota bacterium]|nr:DivIVA domain-containing protein [Candidatus Cloacimonadota bacterium]